MALSARDRELVDAGWTPPNYQAVPAGHEVVDPTEQPEVTIAKLSTLMSPPGWALTVDELLGDTPEHLLRNGPAPTTPPIANFTPSEIPYSKPPGESVEVYVREPAPTPAAPTIDEKLDKLRDSVTELLGRVSKLEP